jgi:hypothetical protein
MFSYQQGDFESFMYLYQHGALLRNEKCKLGDFPSQSEKQTKFIEAMLLFFGKPKSD